jgi:glycerol kinase
VWSSPDELAATWRLGGRFQPEARDERGYTRWRAAVQCARDWARED